MRAATTWMTAALALSLTAAPLAIGSDGRWRSPEAAAKNGNGGSNGGGNRSEKSERGDRGGGKSAKSGSMGASGKSASVNRGHGKSKAPAAAPSETVTVETVATTSPKKGPLHPSKLGSLNGFLHASPTALANASEKSALGRVAKTYAAALAAYLGTSAEAPEGDTQTSEDAAPAVSLDGAAAALAAAANKPLSPEIVAAINAKLAATDPALASLADPASEESKVLAAAMAERANALKAGTPEAEESTPPPAETETEAETDADVAPPVEDMAATAP